MKESSLITIGITCFNAEQTIERALQSAIGQSWKNKEIILVDDCSDDNSLAVVKKIIKPFSFIRLIQNQSNMGVGFSRQKILENAKGEYIAFFDDDDESLAERIEMQYQKIFEFQKTVNTTLIACYCSGKRIYPDGYLKEINAIGSRQKIPHGSLVANYLLFFGGDRQFFFGSGTPSCSLMASRKTFESVGGFDQDFRRVEDVDFAVRLALKGGYFIGCSEQIFFQYATKGLDKSPENNLNSELKLIKKHKGYLKKVGYYYYASNWPYLRYYHFKKQYFKLLFILFKLVIRYPLKAPTHFFRTSTNRIIHELKVNNRKI